MIPLLATLFVGVFGVLFVLTIRITNRNTPVYVDGTLFVIGASLIFTSLGRLIYLMWYA
jgi:hypothetical protein